MSKRNVTPIQSMLHQQVGLALSELDRSRAILNMMLKSIEMDDERVDDRLVLNTIDEILDNVRDLLDRAAVDRGAAHG